MLDFIKALLWPAIALAGLILFAQPVQRILYAVPDVLNQAESIDYGSFKISVKKSSLPKPNAQVSAAIGKMDRNTLELLLESGPNVRHCDPTDATTQARFSALVEIGLGQHLAAGSRPGERCSGVEINELGNNVREFFIGLMRSQFERGSNAN